VEQRLESACRRWQTLPSARIEATVRAALDEDIGRGDITSALTIDPATLALAFFRAEAAGVISGLRVAEMAMRLAVPDAQWEQRASDGDDARPGDDIASVHGAATGILGAERVALNLLQRMSGIATLTNDFVSAVVGTQARIVDTRKTAPGLRLLDKYAVVCGGGHNHRFGLDDGILIKDNHIAAAGGIARALRRARRSAPQGMKIEIEADSLDQIEEAVREGADIILLDNMNPSTMAEAVGLIGGRAETEASGGVNLDTVAAIAQTGVDYISVGRLTHSAPALDISLDLTLDT
jgi:nicotinate-nucleotide pyrophosphorylase (carboxylating)